MRKTATVDRVAVAIGCEWELLARAAKPALVVFPINLTGLYIEHLLILSFLFPTEFNREF